MAVEPKSIVTAEWAAQESRRATSLAATTAWYTMAECKRSSLDLVAYVGRSRNNGQSSEAQSGRLADDLAM